MYIFMIKVRKSNTYYVNPFWDFFGKGEDTGNPFWEYILVSFFLPDNSFKYSELEN